MGMQSMASIKFRMWHGILVDAAFVDPHCIKRLRKFAEKEEDGWTIIGVEISEFDFDSTIAQLQAAMRRDEPFYLHFYNDEELVIVFYDRVFRVGSHISSWKPVIEFARTRKFPEDQLAFWPNRRQDERHYFNA